MDACVDSDWLNTGRGGTGRKYVLTPGGLAYANRLLASDSDRAIIQGRRGLNRIAHEVDEQAFKTYVRMSIDVVITDLVMPNVDGLEFIVALRTLFPDASIIAVSGQGPKLLAAARRKGARVALSKPVDANKLSKAITQAIPDGSNLQVPKSKSVVRGNYRPLDAFEFDHKGRVRCIPAGSAMAEGEDSEVLVRTTEPLWDIRVDGASIGQVDANLHETMETVRKAATKLIDELRR